MRALASPPLPPPRSRQALTAREGANRVEGSAPLGLGPAGPGARELAREKPCCLFPFFLCVPPPSPSTSGEVERGARLRRAPSRSLAQRLALGRVIFPTTRGPTAVRVSNGLLQGSWGRRRIECCSSARREPDFSAPPEPPKQPISVTQDFRHPRSEADSLGAAGRSLERKSSFLVYPPPRSRQALTVQKERRGV